MTRIVYIIRELLRNIYRNPGTALGSLLSLTLLFFLFDLFWIAAGTSEQFYEDLIADLQADVFVAESMPDSTLGELATAILMVEGVQTVTYVSKEDARAQLAAQIGTDLLIGYDSLNPLPRSYVLTFETDYLNLSAMTDIEDKLAVLPGVTDVAYSRQWLEKVEHTKGIILRLGLALGAIIVLTALISSTNNIRLMARARALGFRQMLLQGASRSFVAMPFLIEGFLMAGLAAAAGWLGVIYGRQQVTFTRFDVVLPGQEEIIGFCLVCAVLGLISGYLGVRKQLKV